MCNNGYVMNEKQTEAQVVRPTKKQRELLNFIQTFINEPAKVTSNKVEPGEEKWLVEKVEHAFSQVEQAGSELAENSLDHLYVLIGALKVLGLEGAAQSYLPRLTALKQKQAV
jgi:hypothetical protein